MIAGIRNSNFRPHSTLVALGDYCPKRPCSDLGCSDLGGDSRPPNGRSSGKETTMGNSKPRLRGRPVKQPLPDPISDTPENIAKAILATAAKEAERVEARPGARVLGKASGTRDK